jgi:hypothetical protein
MTSIFHTQWLRAALAAKYLTYLPTEDQLRQEIERQKAFFAQQHGLPTANENGPYSPPPVNSLLSASANSST